MFPINTKKEIFDKFHTYWSEINATYERYAKNLGISYSALQVLYQIYASDSFVTQSMICAKTHLPKTTVNAIIAGFGKQDYLELTQMKNNRRQKEIHLTNKGLDYARPIMEQMSHSEMQAFSMLDKTVMEAMISGIESYQKNFDKILNEN